MSSESWEMSWSFSLQQKSPLVTKERGHSMSHPISEHMQQMPWESLAGTLDLPSTTSANPVSLWAGQGQWQRGQQGAEHPTANCIWGVPHSDLLSFRDPLALHIPTSRGGWRKQHHDTSSLPWGVGECSTECTSAASSVCFSFFADEVLCVFASFIQQRAAHTA